MSNMRIRRANSSDGHCSSCIGKADYYINLNGWSFRMCDTCFRMMVATVAIVPAVCGECGQEKPRTHR